MRTSKLLVLLAAAALAMPAAATPRVGDRDDKLVVTTFAHDKVTADALRGHVVIVNYWATWCGPCKRELPLLDAYARAHAGEGLRVFAVASQDSVPAYLLKPLAAALSFPLARSAAGGGFGSMPAVPTNYVIGRDGVVRYAAAGAFDEAALDRIVTPLLAATQ